MKRFISMLMVAVMTTSITVVSAFATEQEPNETGIVVSDDGTNQVITIKGQENIKKYQASLGEVYDPNLVAVRRTINNISSAYGKEDISPFLIFREYYVKNKKVTSSTNFGTVLKEYKRPAGKVSISEGIDITTSFTADAGISAELLEAKLGFSVSSTDTFQIEWEETYTYPVTLKVYPIYQKITGEIWDKDVQYDDFVGNFTVYRAIGDDVRVYRR